MYVGLLAADTMSVSLHVINEKFGVRYIGLIIKVFQVDPSYSDFTDTNKSLGIYISFKINYISNS